MASRYKVLTEKGVVENCFIRGRVKFDIDVFVGDIVEVVQSKRETIITKVYPRKNVLIRPYVSNVDKLIIVVAPLPAPDFLLVDKLIINCYKELITPVLCLNKADLLTEKERKDFFSEYENDFRCITVSCEDEKIGIAELIEEIEGLVCFAGQSAVGKSTIINKIFNKEIMKTGEMSEKISRGKNTTRHIELFSYQNGLIADTCGFSMLELNEKSSDIHLYYDSFMEYSVKCKYRRCTHISEPECAVKAAVKEGKLPEGRYARYCVIFNELKEKEDTMYD